MVYWITLYNNDDDNDDDDDDNNNKYINNNIVPIVTTPVIHFHSTLANFKYQLKYQGIKIIIVKTKGDLTYLSGIADCCRSAVSLIWAQKSPISESSDLVYFFCCAKTISDSNKRKLKSRSVHRLASFMTKLLRKFTRFIWWMQNSPIVGPSQLLGPWRRL